jgi:hypothetical protein
MQVRSRPKRKVGVSANQGFIGQPRAPRDEGVHHMTDMTTKALLLAIALGLGLTTFNTWPRTDQKLYSYLLTMSMDIQKKESDVNQLVADESNALESDLNATAQELNKRIELHGCR